MLGTLHIQNFAIVSKLLLECPNKMSAFTGETGAGKSITIDALNILLGSRTDSSILRPNSERCEISAQFFYDESSEIDDYLQAHELLGEPGEIIIRRTINKEGRSKFFINDHVSTAQQVKTLGQMLVHIHGQHEQQNLNHHQTHREQLDEFAQLYSQKQLVKSLYQEYQQLLTEFEALSKQTSSDEQLQLWQYQLQELENLNPKEFELDELYKEHHQLNHAQQYLTQINQVQQILDGEEDYNLNRQLHQVAQLLSQLPKDSTPIQNATQLIESAIIQIDETQLEVQQFADGVQIDPERLNQVEQRMSTWHQLARKLQIDAKLLPEHLAVLDKQISNIKSADHKKQSLHQALEQKKSAYLDAAQNLSQARRQHAPELANAIEQIIKELGMPHAKLNIEIQALTDMHMHGMDKVEYMIATNPGSLPGPIAKIASGGELSRISLSIHLITAQRGKTPTLLFDEVDVGIGGATAMKVGQRLRELGERLQVFCVTHQPQVASCAHQHFQVSKYTKDGETFSAIQLLEPEQRIEEIARMLGGLSITEQTKNNAKELLLLAQV